MESHRYIGIDPGKSGYWVMLDGTGKVVNHDKTPLVGRAYDKQSMVQLLQECAALTKYVRVHAVLEDVHANVIGGKASNFDLGNGKGLWEMALMALKIPHTMVTPKEWQKYMFQGAKTQYQPTKRITKKGTAVKKVDTKATALLAAKMLMPQQDWRVVGKTGKFTTKIDDGFVDAYLMAEYCRRKFK